MITNNTNIWDGEDIFLKKVPDPLYTSTINVQYLHAGEADAQTLTATVLAANSASINSLSSGTISVSSIVAQILTASTIAGKNAYISTLSTTAINLDGNILTTSTTSGVSEILINGIPIATTSTLASSILMWSKYPQVDTLNSAGYDISSTRNLYASTIQATSGNLSTISVSTIVANSEIVNFVSAQQILTSSLTTPTVNAITGNFSTLLVSSINSGSANFSTILAAGISTNTISTNNLYAVDATFQNAPTFNNGATFNGGRPNFNSGFITSGANNFNNTSIDNAPNINTQSGQAMTIRADGGMTLASKFNIQQNASTNITLQTDRGADVGGNSVINLNAKYGAKTEVNITADTCSVYSVVPTSNVNITAKGNSSIPPSFVPIGGKITLSAEAGSGSGTAVIAYGEIDIIANSYSATQPGFIKLSGGSNAMYSGATSPVIGVYGQNYIWGQLGNSFTASSTPPVIPTLAQSNYFYAGLGILGPSGQIVGNRFQGGIGVDFIQPFSGGDLVIQGSLSGTDGITMSSIRVINMSTSGAITGVGNINLSSINSAPYPPTIPSTVYISTFSEIITSTLTGNPNYLAITATRDINVASNLNINLSTKNVSVSASTIGLTASTIILTSPTSGLVNINNRVFTTNASNWTNGTVNTLYGSEVLSAKYIQWSYDNNPGTGIYDNNNILVSSQTVAITGTNAINITSPGTNFYGSVGINSGDLYMNAHRLIDTSIIQNASGDLSINIPAQTYFNNAGFVQFNVDHVYMYRGYLDMNNHPIYMNNATIYNAGELYNNNTDLRLLGYGRNITLQTFTAGNIDIVTPSTSQISINQPGSSDVTLFNNGDAHMVAKRNLDLGAGGNIDIDCPSTNQITIYQRGGSDFALFPGGDTRMNAVKDAYVQSTRNLIVSAVGGNIDINTVSSQNITLAMRGTGNQSYFQLGPGGNAVLNSRTYTEIIAGGGSDAIYMTAAGTEFRGNIGFNSTNRYITNLAHIYGDTAAGGGGLAIDYMYGMFFNSAGHNANMYVDSGNLNITNYASGINISNYSAAGAGNTSLYSANNDLYVATGTGKDIIMNCGRTVAVNAALPGGNFNVYTSTINTTSLLDTNITANRYISFNASQPGGSLGIYASTINATTLLDTNFTMGQNLNITATGSAQLRASYFNFFNDCYFNNKDLHDCQNIYFGYGPYIRREIPGGYTNAFLNIFGAGGDGQLRLINGSAEVALRGNSDLGITPTSGYNIVLNGPTVANSNLNMNNHNITNVSTISMVSTATIVGTSTMRIEAPEIDIFASRGMVLYGGTNGIDLVGTAIKEASDITAHDTLNLESGAATGDIKITAIVGNIIEKSPNSISLIAGTGFRLTDTSSGGTGLLTVDAANHLYWNGTFIA